MSSLLSLGGYASSPCPSCFWKLPEAVIEHHTAIPGRLTGWGNSPRPGFEWAEACLLLLRSSALRTEPWEPAWGLVMAQRAVGLRYTCPHGYQNSSLPGLHARAQEKQHFQGPLGELHGITLAQGHRAWPVNGRPCCSALILLLLLPAWRLLLGFPILAP